MKCHRKASPYTACFASRSCARFSPTIVTPASSSTAMSCNGTYLVAATTVTRGPASSRTRSTRARTSSGDIADDSLHAARPAVAPVREEEVGAADRAQVDAVDPHHSRRAEQALRGAPEVEPTAARQVGIETLGNLLAHLVAARACRRADDGVQLGTGTDPHRGGSGSDQPGSEAAPACVQHGE